MANAWSALAASIAALGLVVDPQFERRARVFLEELRRWSQVGALTGYRTEAEQVEHLLLESLLLLAVLPSPATPLLDIGSGPGVPGLVLKLARPAWQITLVEARRRPVNFVRHVIRVLALEGVSVQQGRAERLPTAVAQGTGFRSVTLRAVAALPRAVDLARPYVHRDGHVVVPLGPGARPSFGRVVGVTVPGPGLPVRRAFLIIGAAEVAAVVSRGTPVPRETRGRATREGRGSGSGRGEPEGRRGEDHDRHQSRRSPRDR